MKHPWIGLGLGVLLIMGFAMGLAVGPSRAANAATPVLMKPGAGSNPLAVQHWRDEIWMQPPNLEGLIASSEIIAEFNLDTELATDFVLAYGATIQQARWWGGYYNWTEGDPRITRFRIRWFESSGCLPGALVREDIFNDNCNETFIGYQGGYYPLYEYSTAVPDLAIPANTRYWFGPTGTHVFPPQWGRLEAAGAIVECEAAFRSEYFGYPEWTRQSTCSG